VIHRRRKVKCDESRPECRRCTTAGRSCGGYAHVVSKQPPASAASPAASGVSYGASTWLSTDLEKRSFDLFVTRAARRLGGFFHEAFWSREVLQAAIGDSCIRHLIVALGAAYELFERPRPGPTQLVACSSSSDRADVQFALEQCNKAIRLLSQPGTGEEESAQVALRMLTASILFTAFASMQGDTVQAINHVRSGLEVLQDLESDQQRAGLGQQATSAFPIPISRLRALLVGFCAQVRAMTSDDTWLKCRHDPLVSDTIRPPTCYPTLGDAQQSVEELFCNTLALVQSNELQPAETPERAAEIRERHALLVRTLRASRAALDDFAANRDRTTLDQIASSMAALRMYQVSIAIRLEVGLHKDRETAFDVLDPLFIEMLGHARAALQTPAGLDSAPIYSSGLGVVMPLHLIAARCRNPVVRMEAAELLCRAGRRDGLWDSTVAGKIVSTTIAIEREGISSTLEERPTERFVENPAASARVARAKRVAEVKISFEKDSRGARFDFITVAGYKNKVPACQRVIEW